MENDKDLKVIEQLQYINWMFSLPITVSFSGGKDSITLWNLVKRSGIPATAQYNFTTVDPPELVRFIRSEYPEVVRSRSKKTMWQLIVQKGMPPMRIVRYCCDKLKERKLPGITMTGIRWDESTARSKRVPAELQCKKRILIHPIIHWSEIDVWAYIDERGLKYPDLYETEGINRIGCIGCPMSGPKGMLRSFERWPKYKEAYIRAFQRMVDKRKADGLKTSWATGQELFDWWIKPPKRKRRG